MSTQYHLFIYNQIALYYCRAKAIGSIFDLPKPRNKLAVKHNELIKEILSGNREAENRLFLEFGNRIALKVKFRLGHTHPESDDLISDINIAVLQSIRKGYFDPEKGTTLGTYINGIVNNKLKDHFKGVKREHSHRQSVKEQPVDLVSNPRSSIEEEELKNSLRKVLALLKPKYKEVLFYKFYEEMSVPEISQKIGIEPRRVSERIHYAIQLLRKECQKNPAISSILSR